MNHESSNVNENVDIFHYIFMKVLLEKYWYFPEENVFKHDLSRTMFNCNLCEVFLKNFQLRVFIIYRYKTALIQLSIMGHILIKKKSLNMFVRTSTRISLKMSIVIWRLLWIQLCTKNLILCLIVTEYAFHIFNFIPLICSSRSKDEQP